MKIILISISFWILFASTGLGCSAFILKSDGEIVLGKNFDWTFRDGIILLNQRGEKKSAYYTHDGIPAEWVSRYGSITFNQNGKDMPYGGMNEAGLVIEMLWMDLTVYNIAETKPYLNELEWIQYHLDQFATVNEVLLQLEKTKVYPIKGKIHYILTDPTGDSMIVEYINGQPVAYQKDTNTCQAITNKSVVHSEPYKNQIKGIRKNNSAPSYRYYKIEQQMKKMEAHKGALKNMAFEILQDVTIPSGAFKTMWTIVYSLHTKEISFFSDTHPSRKTISLESIDFLKAPAFIHLNQHGDALMSDHFTPLDTTTNNLITTASLLHLGFNKEMAADMSGHRFRASPQTQSVFSEQYFHLSLSFISDKPQTLFIAIMDSEEQYESKQAIDGGYVYGHVQNEAYTMHIYGLKEGRYGMLAFLDKDRNRTLTFGKDGKPVEPYATFGNSQPRSKSEFTYINSSTHLDSGNSTHFIEWTN